MTPCYLSSKKQKSILLSLPFVGIDEFAFLKGHTYGTILCDLIRHEPVALLSDRNVDTVASWLKRHPVVKLVSRDGFRPFRQAISQASTTIIQVYDRWHLLRGAKRQLELYLTSVLPSAASVPNNATDQAEPLSGSIPETKYQRQRWERYEKKWALIRQIQEEHQKGKNISVLAREFQLDRRTIRKYLNTTSIPIIARRKSRRPINDFYEEVKHLEGEKKTVKEIYSLICNNGYTGTFSGVRMTVEKIRKERKNLNDSNPQAKRISRKKIGSLFWRLPEDLSDEELRILKQILERDPELEAFYQSLQTFRKSIKEANYDLFLDWLREKLNPENRFFYHYALQLRSELQAIKQSFLTRFSNGPVEGHINRLKLLKRMMYGRAKIGLLEKRVLYHL